MTTEFRGATRIVGPDACREILLVGELNPYGSDPRYALYHEPKRAAGYQLQHKIFGIEARRWYLPMWRVNLCVGDWDGRDATRKARELAAPGAPWTTIVMLGVKVAKAFEHATGAAPAPFCDSMQDGHPTLLSLPHPSLRNTTWTNPNAIALARSSLRSVIPLIPWGEIG